MRIYLLLKTNFPFIGMSSTVIILNMRRYLHKYYSNKNFGTPDF